MPEFDPYELYSPVTGTTGQPRASNTTRRRDQHEDDADSYTLPELPKHGPAASPVGFSAVDIGTGYSSQHQQQQQATQRPGKGRPPSLSLLGQRGGSGPHAIAISRGSSPGSGGYSSASQGSAYYLKADDYSLPPTADATKGLLDDDSKYYRETIFPGGPSPLPPSRRQPSLQAPPGATWWTRTFEPPDWKQLAVHIMLCLIAFPAISLILPLAQGSIFWVRVYVSLGCSLVGLSIGYSLLQLVRKWIEAAGEIR
jgi:hypothetical protein